MERAEPSPERDEDPRTLVERLAACRAPLLLPVRHHSPACAAAIPALLEAFAPERVLVELPADLQGWVEWLGHPALEAPVAVASAGVDGEGLAFYPFADFSPELAAIRWAAARQVPVEAFDRPVSDRGARRASRPKAAGPAVHALARAFCAAGGAEDTEALWDQLVEARAPGAPPERVRRAALAFGLALRLDASATAIDPEDLLREGHMRARLAACGGARVAAVVGSFHAAALLPEPLLWAAPPEPTEPPERPRGGRARRGGPGPSSLVPYAFELLDSRSGYPAGIRDPVWQQRALEALRDGRSPEALVAGAAVEICRALRERGHVAGLPDANEVARLAVDLARLRGLPGPGRRELLEAVASALGHGELLGRGRAVARALERVLVGERRGRLPPACPRSGLGPHLDALLAELRLPPLSAQTPEPVDLRLDPLRSELDRRRHVALERLLACGIPYASRERVAGLGDTEALGTAWRVQVTPATQAVAEHAGVLGVTLAQAAEGALRRARIRLDEDERLGARARLELLERAAECGLAGLAAEGLCELMGPFVAEAGLVELLAGAALVERIVRGHVPGLPTRGEEPGAPREPGGFEPPEGTGSAPLVAAAIRAVEGLSGSERIEDAQGLLELVRWHERQPADRFVLGDGRLRAALERMARDGSPLMQGAATGARVLLELAEPGTAGVAAGSWVDAAAAPAARAALARRLQGLLTVCGPRLESDPDLVAGLVARVEALPDAAFLERVAALRDGFDVLTPAARQRLLDAIAERHGVDPRTLRARAAREALGPRELALLAGVDRRASARLEALGLRPPPRDADVHGPSRQPTPAGEGASGGGALAGAGTSPPPPADGAHAIAPLDRWRLVLGRERERLAPPLRPAARALDELYGAGRGEGERSGVGGGGDDVPFPSARLWGEELEALFGARVREEVLGRAAVRGRAAAALALDPDAVIPSVELLEQVLSLKGAIPEAQLGSLRRLVARIVEALVKELAVRVQPALAGLTVPRPTRRPGGPLDLRRTVARNLRTVRPAPSGGPLIVPEQPVFRTRSRRSLDWRIVLAVDVSGSMEPSVIYSAVMAAILGGLPSVSVHFLAFSTEVIDLSHRVPDPLGLLLEVAVGGGTDIGKALRYARGLVTVPSRTLLLLVSDLEEGFGVERVVAEARGLVESGVKALGLAALDDAGKPRYDVAVAEQLAAAGMPVAALTPLELAAWIGEQVR